MQKLETAMVFGLFFLYFIIYKFVFLNSVLYLSIRERHSKSYIKKHKENNFIKKLFYTHYKNDIPKFYYYQNIIIVISIIANLITGIVSAIVSYKVLQVLFLIMISLFYLSLLNWEIEATFSRIKPKSLIFKILISIIYSVLTFLVIYQIGKLGLSQWIVLFYSS